MNERITTLEEQFEKFRIVGGSGVNVEGSLGTGYVLDLRRRLVGGEGADGGPPPPPTGACCVGTACTVGTEDDCISAGGTYQGDHSTCSPNPCEPPPPTGACCVGTTCSVESSDDCTAAGGTYQGDGTDCDPNPCSTPPPPGQGACCAVDNTCSITTPENCAAAGGSFEGIGTVCDPNPCGVEHTCGACYFTNPFAGDGKKWLTRTGETILSWYYHITFECGITRTATTTISQDAWRTQSYMPGTCTLIDSGCSGTGHESNVVDHPSAFCGACEWDCDDDPCAPTGCPSDTPDCGGLYFNGCVLDNPGFENPNDCTLPGYSSVAPTYTFGSSYYIATYTYSFGGGATVTGTFENIVVYGDECT